MSPDFEDTGFKEAEEEINWTFVPSELEKQLEPGNVYPEMLQWHQSGCMDTGLEVSSHFQSHADGTKELCIYFGHDSFGGMTLRGIIQEIHIDMAMEGDREHTITFDPTTKKLVHTVKE